MELLTFKKGPTVAQTATLHTNHGDIICQLFPDQAPHTVANFVGLASRTKVPGSGSRADDHEAGTTTG